MLEEVLKLLSAVVGALCAAFIPLLQRARRTQQEVELGLKEAERIEKILNVSAKLKADYGGQTDISRVNARLRLVIADMASDEEKSVAMIQEYVATTPTSRRGIVLTRLPPIRSPHRLSLTLRFLRILPLAVPLVLLTTYILAMAESHFTEYPITSLPFAAPFRSLVIWINYFSLGKFSGDMHHLPELVKVMLGTHPQTPFLLIIELTFNYLVWLIISRLFGHSILLSYLRRHPELFSSND
jgi:hypothetical protein